MVFIIKETEQPKKKLSIQRIKLHMPKGDYLQFLSFLLVLADIASIMVCRQLESGITGLLIAIVVLSIVHREEERKSGNSDQKQGEVKVVNAPQV